MSKTRWPFFLLILLTSCGFKLRNYDNLPTWLHQIAIIIDQGQRDLKPMLTNAFKATNVSVTSKAYYELHIEHDEIQQIISNVSASTTPRQYQLNYILYFSLQTSSQHKVIPTQKIIVTRQLTVNNNRILSSNAEEALIYREMHQEAVSKLLSRISKRPGLPAVESGHY